MPDTAKEDTRKAERVSTTLPVQVEALQPGNKVWREVSHLRRVSKIGADFYLNRFFAVGQLLSLTLPLEKQFRCYDHDADQYGIWGIVRHCRQMAVGKSYVYHIGVAFIGPEPPFGYHINPATIYKLSEIDESGLWRICEDDSPSSTRKQPRYSIPIEIYIAVCDADENIVTREDTVTENISAGGAAVFSALDLKVGAKVKVFTQSEGFSTVAIVRNRRVGIDNLPRLHLEFITVRFPLDGID